MNDIATIFITLMMGALTSNAVLNQGLSICSFLGVSKKTSNAFGMGAAVTFVLVISSLIVYGVQYSFIVPFKLEYLDLIVFILIIAALVQLLDIVLKRFAPTMYSSLGVYLPLVTTNCVIIYTVRRVVGYDLSTLGLLQAFLDPLFVGLGFILAICLMSGVRERLALGKIPKTFEGFPIVLIAAGIFAMAFSGFIGFKI
ncbi:MAG: electron transport complex subunit RsxA [Clostridiales bacterium]|jgi:electron transport complex protein RnfA|nr:electron transport complex subunit RsxA [Clostridiales bacterium]